MKKIFTHLLLVLSTITLFAQVPQKLSYQFIVRNASGVLVAGAHVGVRVAILQGSPTGSVVYQELFNPNPLTNANGLVSIEIGTGVPITGTFNSINWAGGPYFLKTETDPAGGTNYSVVGTSELLSVPYAIYSGTTGSISDNSVTSAKIVDGTITAADLGTGSVTSVKITDATIATADIANSAVTTAKINSSGAATDNVLQFTGSAVSWGYAPGTEIKSAMLNVTGTSSISITSTSAKQTTIGTFNKLRADSKLELTFHGRIFVASLTGNGAYFELRVDDNLATYGGVALIKNSEAGGNDGIPVSMTAIFTGLSTGNRTISIWIKTTSGTGTTAMVNPGNFLGNYLIIKEIQ